MTYQANWRFVYHDMASAIHPLYIHIDPSFVKLGSREQSNKKFDWNRNHHDLWEAYFDARQAPSECAKINSSRKRQSWLVPVGCPASTSPATAVRGPRFWPRCLFKDASWMWWAVGSSFNIISHAKFEVLPRPFFV